MSLNVLIASGAFIIIIVSVLFLVAYGLGSSNLSDDSFEEDGTDESLPAIPKSLAEKKWDLDEFIKRLDALPSSDAIQAKNAVLKGKEMIEKEEEENPDLNKETNNDGENIEQEAVESEELIRQYREVQQELQSGGGPQVDNEYNEVREGTSNLAEINPLSADAANSLAENQNLIASNQAEINTTSQTQTSVDPPPSATHQATNSADQVENESDETIKNDISE